MGFKRVKYDDNFFPASILLKSPPAASWPGTMINPQWLELPMSQTNFYVPKDVRAIDVRLCKCKKLWTNTYIDKLFLQTKNQSTESTGESIVSIT